MFSSAAESGKGSGVQLVGVLSDTHGLLRDSVLEAFEGVELIVHAGDIGAPEVIDGLREVAPVVAVRGNMDGDWAQMRGLRQIESADIGGIRLLVIHDLGMLGTGWRQQGCTVVVSGHTHEPAQETVDDVLFLNPGSAGRQSTQHPPSALLLRVEDGQVDSAFVMLD